MYLTAEKIDHDTDWESVSFWRLNKGGVFETPAGQAVIHEFEGRCDHETCYETHDTRLVFALEGRYFLKTGTYDSSDGYQWNGKLREVKPVEKTVQDWDDVPMPVWDAAGISAFLRKWMSEQPSTKWSSYDWTNLWYAAQKSPLEIEGFPFQVKGVEQYVPGEEDCTGPVWLIFDIGGIHYAAKGRNVSHVGWDFDDVFALEPVEKKTVTAEVWR